MDNLIIKIGALDKLKKLFKPTPEIAANADAHSEEPKTEADKQQKRDRELEKEELRKIMGL